MKALLTLLSFMVAYGAFAQQAPQYSQYIFNGLAINPAYAGSQKVMQINATHRSQWTGMEGAPTTQAISIDGAELEERLGLGLSIVSDRLGAQRNLAISTSVAVRKRIGEQSELSLGIALGMAQYSLDGTMLTPGSTLPDVAIPQGKETSVLPDLKVGAFFNTERFYAGLSMANVVNFKEDKLYINTPARHIFLTSGYVFDVSPSVRLKPSFLLKEDFKSPTNIDANLFVLFYDRLWFGGSYRMGVPVLKDSESKENLAISNALAVMTQVYVTPTLRIGYSYDISLSKMRNYGGHEITVGYALLRKRDGRMLTPRYF